MVCDLFAEPVVCVLDLVADEPVGEALGGFGTRDCERGGEIQVRVWSEVWQAVAGAMLAGPAVARGIEVVLEDLEDLRICQYIVNIFLRVRSMYLRRARLGTHSHRRLPQT